MRIILGAWHVSGYAGTQTWAYTLAQLWREQGHDVVFYSSGKGRMGMRILNEGFEHWSIGEAMPEGDFAVISQPRVFMVCARCTQTCAVDDEGVVMPHPHRDGPCSGGGKPGRDTLPTCKRVYVCHGWLEQERPWKDGTPYFTVCKERQGLLQDVSGIEAAVIAQPINLDRFCPRKPLREKSPIALVLSTWPAAREQVEKAGLEAGVRIVWPSYQRWDIENAINNADILIGTGRGICEAMACGRVGLVAGKFGCDGIVRPGNIDNVADFNFSGRATARPVEETLAEELRKYGTWLGEWSRAEALRRFSPEPVAAALLEAA